MGERKRIIVLIAIMAAVAAITIGVTIKMLYDAAIDEESDRLTETVQSQARLIESIARFHEKNGANSTEEILTATLAVIRDAHKRYEGSGQTAEFTMSRLEKDNISFLLKHRHSDLNIPEPVPWNSALAEPMRQALSGKSGVIIGLDYSGVEVLAAFEPVSVLSLGIVAKLDMAEIRRPFVKAGAISGLVALLSLAFGALLFVKLTEPMLIELKEHRDHLQELVERRTVELELVIKELEELSYIVSHDLREPLRGINNFALMLLEDYGETLDPQGRHMLETLTKLSKRQEQQIVSILDYSRVGRKALDITEINPNDILNQVVDSLEISLVEKNVDVLVPVLLPNIYFDPTNLFIIFNNLITNAIKYSDKAEKLVEVGFIPPTDDSEIVFYVRDNGIGIPLKHQGKIFTMFKRLHGKDEFGGGTGAGLAIVKKIVERHLGRIWLESTVNQGTTFFMAFSSITQPAS